MKRKISLLVVLVTVIAMCLACTANLTMKPWSEQTNKERLAWIVGIYNAQDRDYRAMAEMAILTQNQKDVLKKKKEIMLKVYPLIDAYRVTVESGGSPDVSTEQAILNLLNQLQSIGG